MAAPSRTDPALRRLATSVCWPGFRGRIAPEWLLAAIDDGLPGVVYFAQNVDPEDPTGLGRLSSVLRRRGATLLGIDEEGGTVTRLEAEQGSSFPSAAQLGRVDDVEATRAVSRGIGALCAAAGVTIVLAPDADVNTSPRNPVIGVRSFGAATSLVSRHVAAAVAGFHEAGVLACAKHFPGHGDTIVDSHRGLPRVDTPLDELRTGHMVPFDAAVSGGVDAVMTAHIVVPELGDEPATLNPRAIGLLRESGFDGLVITDALDMAAIDDTIGAGEGGVRALLAGADLLCIGNPDNLGPRGERNDEDDFTLVRDAVADALASGRIPRERVEEAAARIAHASETVRKLDAGGSRAALAEARRVAARIASASLAIGEHARAAAPAGDSPLGSPLMIDARARLSAAVAAGSDPLARQLNARRVWAPDPDDARDAVRGSIAPVVVVLDAGAAGAQEAVVAAVRSQRPDAIVIDVGWHAPVDAEPAVPARTIRAGGGGRATADAIARALGWGDADLVVASAGQEALS